MALSQRLQLRQSQALVMTPQLMQAIKLLQLSNLDLTAYVEGELESNPLLERESESDLPGGEPDAPQAEAAPDGDAQAGDWMGEDLQTSRTDMEAQLGTGLDNVFPEDSGQTTQRPGSEAPQAASEWVGTGSGGTDRGDYNLEAFISAETTLADHLAEQLSMTITDPARRMIGQYLIDLVDEAGYLAGDLETVAQKLGAPLREVEAVLEIIQGFDPAGVCARNLNECLAIQLKERDRFDPAMRALVANLPMLANRQLGALKKICEVSDEDLADMIGEIRRLNPKPGFAFGSAMVQAVIPDVFVRPGADGGWLVELNSETLPKVLVNQNYYAKISKTTRADGEKNYLAECLQNATWLVRALDQRARTILKVSTEIVRQQDGFFAQGVQHLRPLNLKTVADAISMHESTVSRVTANKYMATSRGVFELKYFFTSSISSADGGEAHSAEAVRHRIKQLIDAEDGRGVLSDDSIVEKLRESGIDIARRTVAKYREAMRIPSSIRRRRDKQAASPYRDSHVVDRARAE